VVSELSVMGGNGVGRVVWLEMGGRFSESMGKYTKYSCLVAHEFEKRGEMITCIHAPC